MNEIEQTFQKLYGLPCWRVHYEPLLNLSLNFGAPNLWVREPLAPEPDPEALPRPAARRIVIPRGEWWLWLNARWRFSMNGDRVATSSSSLKKRLLAVRDLDGQKLVEAFVRPRTGATRLAFDLGGVLEVWRLGRQEDRDLWLLYEPDGQVLSVRGDGTYEHGPASDADKAPGVARRPVTRR